MTTQSDKADSTHHSLNPDSPSPKQSESPSLLTGEKAVSPMVSDLKISALPMTGFEVVPIAESNWSGSQTCKYQWFIESEDDRWLPVGHTSTFVPEVQHVGRKIKLRCIPFNSQKEGRPLEVINKDTVTLGPEYGGISQRQQLTPSLLISPRQIRVITYNILFNGYLRRDYATDYSYCPDYVLEESFRQQLVVKELMHYHGDLLCLQEVGPQVFTNYLQPTLEASGYKRLFSPKINDFGEGLATFYRTDKLSVLQTSDIVIRDALINDDAFISLCDTLRSSHEEVFQLVSTLDTVFQMSIFTIKDGSFIVVNTHLYWPPSCELVRLVQSHVILHYIERLQKDCGLKDIGIIFCGDLNHEPGSATFHYINEGEFQFRDISTKDQFKLGHSLSLINATGTPLYSCLVDHTQLLLDYIYVDDQCFHVLQAIPIPTEDELKLDGRFALPSCRFASDHLALGVDIEILNNW